MKSLSRWKVYGNQDATYWNAGAYCRAYPDEKGIETSKSGQVSSLFYCIIAEPIPMKRELKRSPLCLSSMTHLIAEPIPMKRELKHVQLLLEVNPVWAALQSLSRWKGTWNETLGNSPSKWSLIAQPLPMQRYLTLSIVYTNPSTSPHIFQLPSMKINLRQEFFILRC